MTVNLLLFEWLSAAVVDSVPLCRLLTHCQAASVAAGQQHGGQWHGRHGSDTNMTAVALAGCRKMRLCLY